MKTTNNNLASKFALAAFLALGTLAVTSCNKDKSQNGQETPADQSQLVVRVAGISDGESNSIKTSKSSTSRNNSSNNSIELVQSNGFDAVVAIDNNAPSTDASPLSQAGLRASSGLKAVSTPLASTTTYRLYLYKNNGGTYTFTKSMQFTPGTEAPVQIPNGSYKWVALSHNNTDALPDADASNNLLLPENKDVLYATSGATDIVINSNTAPLNITFNRLYARIAIEVNTLGMFAPINSATIAVTGQNAKAATFNLTSGALTLAPTGGVPALTEVNFTDLDGNASRKVAYYYTADQTAQNLTVSVTNLKIQLDNGTERNFGATALTQIKSITPERGKNHRFLVGITESALTYGGVNWSRSNLYYKPNDPTPYRFYHTNPQTNDPNSFFSFGAHRPRVLASANAAVDACALVYPAGLWKTPTGAQLSSVTSVGLLGGLLGDLGLTNVAGIDALVVVQDLLAARVAGSTATATYSEFTPSAGNHAAYGAANSAENRLRFNYNGYMNTLGALNNLITLNLGNTYGSYNAFWTSENLIGSPLINLGVKYHLGHTTGGNYKAYRTTSLLSAGLLGAVSVINSPLMNIRCVRDATWAAASAQASYNPMPVYPN